MDDKSYLLLNGQAIDKSLVEDFTDKNNLSKIEIILQDGPVSENGVNGLQIDDVIVIVKDIISSFNKAFPCKENSIVLTKLEEAKMWCDARTADRECRNVEGKNKA